MQFLIVFKARNTVKQSWMIFYLFTPSESSHMAKLEDLLKGLFKEWIENIPKEMSIFKTNLNYVGNEIFIQNKRVCIKPLRSRLEEIPNYSPHYSERI